MSTFTDCDVCGLPDPYNGGGDGIGSCDCPRCDGGEAASSSVLCICPPDEFYDGVRQFYEEDDFLSYLPTRRVEDMLRNPDNRHLY